MGAVALCKSGRQLCGGNGERSRLSCRRLAPRSCAQFFARPPIYILGPCGIADMDHRLLLSLAGERCSAGDARSYSPPPPSSGGAPATLAASSMSRAEVCRLSRLAPLLLLRRRRLPPCETAALAGGCVSLLAAGVARAQAPPASTAAAVTASACGAAVASVQLGDTLEVQWEAREPAAACAGAAAAAAVAREELSLGFGAAASAATGALLLDLPLRAQAYAPARARAARGSASSGGGAISGAASRLDAVVRLARLPGHLCNSGHIAKASGSVENPAA